MDPMGLMGPTAPMGANGGPWAPMVPMGPIGPMRPNETHGAHRPDGPMATPWVNPLWLKGGMGPCGGAKTGILQIPAALRLAVLRLA